MCWLVPSHCPHHQEEEQPLFMTRRDGTGAWEKGVIFDVDEPTPTRGSVCRTRPSTALVLRLWT